MQVSNIETIKQFIFLTRNRCSTIISSMPDPQKKKNERAGSQRTNKYSFTLGTFLKLVRRPADSTHQENRLPEDDPTPPVSLPYDKKTNELYQRWLNLSAREQDVVALTCLGYKNQQIAFRLGRRVVPLSCPCSIHFLLYRFLFRGGRRCGKRRGHSCNHVGRSQILFDLNLRGRLPNELLGRLCVRGCRDHRLPRHFGSLWFWRLTGVFQRCHIRGFCANVIDKYLAHIHLAQIRGNCSHRRVVVCRNEREGCYQDTVYAQRGYEGSNAVRIDGWLRD